MYFFNKPFWRILGFRSLKSTVTVLLLSGLAGCSSMQISADHNPLADFFGLRTFAWHPELNADAGATHADNSALGLRIRTAMEQQLKAEGYQKVNPSEADFWINYHAAVEERLRVTTINDLYQVGWGWHLSDSTRSAFRAYDIGSLILDIIDAGTQELLWRGIAQAEIHRFTDTEKKIKKIERAVENMLENFPPR